MKYTSILALAFLLFACNDKPANTSDPAFKDEMKDREIKRVSEGDIIAEALNRGKIIADSAQKLLGSNLKGAIKSKGIPHALEFCNVAAYPLMDSIELAFGAEIKRVSLRVRNPKDKPNDLERQILEAYQYQVDNNDELGPNVQRDGEDYLLYTKPITIQDGICLKCHGEPGKYLNMEDYEIIKSLYPEDNATGHQVGDLRGMWSIRLSKKKIIKSL